MKIAIEVSPLDSGHKVRGVGFYLSHLLTALRQYDPENTYIDFKKNNFPKDTDLVHYPYFDPFFLSLPVFFRLPTVLTIHDLTPIKFPNLFPPGKKGKVKWQIQKRIARKADAIITDSENSKKDIHKILSVPDEKINVVYLAASEKFTKMKLQKTEMDELLKKYSLPEKFVLYVGDVTPNKNLPVLTQAIEKLKIPLVMVGKALVSTDFDAGNPWNKDQVEVQKYIKDNKLFHALGFVETDDLVKLYNICSAFVFPSFYEGFGLPLIEAMSCGAPVVTTKESSLSEVGGEAPVYADYKSSDSFAHVLSTIIGDDDLRMKMSKKSIEQAKKFSWKKTADQTVKVYKEVYKP